MLNKLRLSYSFLYLRAAYFIISICHYRSRISTISKSSPTISTCWWLVQCRAVSSFAGEAISSSVIYWACNLYGVDGRAFLTKRAMLASLALLLAWRYQWCSKLWLMWYSSIARWKPFDYSISTAWYSALFWKIWWKTQRGKWAFHFSWEKYLTLLMRDCIPIILCKFRKYRALHMSHAINEIIFI